MDTAKEALFRAMLQNDWFTASDGNVDSPFGYFGYVTNTLAEWREVRMAFEEVVDAYGAPSMNEFVGSWFAWIDSNGIIRIHKKDTDGQAKSDYDEAMDSYLDWAGEE